MKADPSRRSRLSLAAGLGFLVLAGVLALIVVDSSGDASEEKISLKGVAAVNKFFAEYPQNEPVIGDRFAPVEMVEYSDLQSAASKQHMERVLVPIIERQVKQGAAKIDFRFMEGVGEDSNSAGAAAYAASLQGRMWNFIGIFFKNQKKENSGYAADDDFLEAVAEAAGVKDLDKWNDDREDPGTTTYVAENTEEGHNNEFKRAPGVTIRGPAINEEIENLGMSPSVKTIEDGIEGAR